MELCIGEAAAPSTRGDPRPPSRPPRGHVDGHGANVQMRAGGLAMMALPPGPQSLCSLPTGGRKQTTELAFYARHRGPSIDPESDSWYFSISE